MRLKKLRCATMEQFRGWVADETRRVKQNIEFFPEICVANGVLSLLNLCIHLVGRQIEAQAMAFEKEGGFTERLYRIRSTSKKS